MRNVKLKDIDMNISPKSAMDKAIFTCANISDKAYIAGLLAGSKEAFSCSGKALFGYLQGNWLWVVLSNDVPKKFYKELKKNMESALSMKGDLMYMTTNHECFLEKKIFKDMGWHIEYHQDINGRIWTKWRCNYGSSERSCRESV